MVCHVDFSVEAIQLSSPPLSDSEIGKEAQLPWGRGEGLYKICDVMVVGCFKSFLLEEGTLK